MGKDKDLNLLKVDEVINPKEECKKRAHFESYEELYQKSLEDREGFWAKIADELHWFRKWDKVLEWKYPYAKWFVGGKTNICYNCLDRNIEKGLRNKVALLYVNEREEERKITYGELYELVGRFAQALKGLGVEKGDRVLIYMPNTPEAVIAMLACARIGAIHSVVFAGFSRDALKTRIEDAQPKVVITATHTIRRGKEIDLLNTARSAVEDYPFVKYLVVWNRKGDVELKENEREFYQLIRKQKEIAPAEVLDSEDPLFILYTSGTTGKPKGILHTVGGYMVGTYVTTKWDFNVDTQNDVYWCTADVGWITGHSYIVYGPLLNGMTTVLYEGAPNYPDPGIWWRIVERYRVNIFYTAPTAIRMFMRYGEGYPKKYDLSSLKVLGSVGEPINPEAWEWYYRVIGGERCPIVDTWWQTETGMHIILTWAHTKAKPGYAGRPFFTVEVDVVDKNGNPLPPNHVGLLVIKTPWPSMLRTVWGNPERYEKYWNIVPGYYCPEDLASKDEEGFITILGRADDVLNVAGHRIGTAEIESAIIEHPSVAESAVIGKPDEIKGQKIKAFVVLKLGVTPSEELKEEIRKTVREVLGPIAVPDEIEFVEKLPKTRSGKIMRRLLRAKELGLEVGDLSTLED
ncbi:MAG: acetate--CoA ligase [Gammaproteobacteria bacterium]|nr:MAG: acetate--CoA ligase [Gammaproteobacteria bacterium]